MSKIYWAHGSAVELELSDTKFKVDHSDKGAYITPASAAAADLKGTVLLPIQAIGCDVASAVDVNLDIGANATMIEVEGFAGETSIFKDTQITITDTNTTARYSITNTTHFKCGVVVVLTFQFLDTKDAAYVQLLGAGVAMTTP